VALKDAKPDGYTLGQIHTGTFRAALMAEKPPTIALTDFTLHHPALGLGRTASSCAPTARGRRSRSSSPRPRPAPQAELRHLRPGLGAEHVMVDLQQRLGIELTHVPYRGGSELYQGLLGSQIDVIADASGWIPLVQSGQFRLLVVWGSQRMKLFPEVRTLKEAGIDLEVNSPYGVCGPKGMDAAVVKKIHDAMKDALFDPATQAVMEKFNMPTLYLDTAAYEKAARAQDLIERENLKRVGMLASRRRRSERECDARTTDTATRGDGSFEEVAMDLNLRGKLALVTALPRELAWRAPGNLQRKAAICISRRGQKRIWSAPRRSIQARHNVFRDDPSPSISATAMPRGRWRRLHDIDILVNNAGAIPAGDLQAIDEARWRDAWDLKVFGYINLCRAVYPA
jgi:hypothetical protein